MKQIQLRMLLISSMFTALCAVGAFIRIPIPPYPVPMTLQTAFLYLAGLLLPKREAFLSQAAYVLLGLIGIPIFTGGGGIGYVVNPTFGYLIAFMLCAPILSTWANKTLYAGRKVLYSIGGIVIILCLQVVGVAYMAGISSLYLGTPLAFSRAVYLVLIFVPLDILKLFTATLLAIQLRHKLPSLFTQNVIAR